MERIETLVIGAGQAGLSASHALGRLGREHLVLEAGDIGETWRSRRWDSFTLVTPNWTVRLPGAAPIPDADGFLPRAEVVELLAGMAQANATPLRTNVAATALDRAPAGAPGRYVTATDAGPIASDNVVIATGWFRVPRVPAWSASIDPGVLQLNATDYRSPAALPDGAVLVIGSAQTGCQIAEDLHLAGREVWLSTGKVGRIPRRYRGRDGMVWWDMLGRYAMTEAELPDPRGRFGPNPHISGARGGHTINLHCFARDGMQLVGHITGVEPGGRRLTVAADLHDNLRIGDRVAAEFTREIDEGIEANGWDAPPPDHEDPTNSDDHLGTEGLAIPIRDSIDLGAAGIGTIVWATGYLPDHRWIHLPIFDEAGHPRHTAGLTEEPGIAFVGLRFQRWLKSDLFYGVAEDAAFVVERLVGAASTVVPG